MGNDDSFFRMNEDAILRAQHPMYASWEDDDQSTYEDDDYYEEEDCQD